MKAKKLNCIIPLVVYPFDVMFSFGQTDEELKRHLSNYNIAWDDKMKCIGRGRCVSLPSNQLIIRLMDYPETCSEYGTLQHEIFHCVTMMFDKMGMKMIVFKSDEAYAYAIGYLTTEIYKKIYK